MEPEVKEICIVVSLHRRCCMVCGKVIPADRRYLYIPKTGWNGRYHNICQDCVVGFAGTLMDQ